MTSHGHEHGSLKKTRVKFRQIQPNDIELNTKEKFHERGQFGEVKKAKWNNHDVAVKYFISADRKGGFSEELRNLSALQNHECIVKLYGACLSAEQPFIVLEFAPLSLEKVIHDKQSQFRYTSDNAINWLLQMAVGLEYIHNKNILHRDIKPSNVLLFDTGKVLKLCDFGTAKTVESTLTNAVGTIRYMAPEVVKSQHYNNSCDIFSFAMVAWEILARMRPVPKGMKKDAAPYAMMYAMAKGDRPGKLLNTPRAMTEMINICWHSEAERRPTMVEVKQKLQYLSKYVELRRPLIFRRQGQPPSKAKSPVDQSDKGGLVMSAIRSPPEQKPPNKRPQHVQFADPDKNARPFAPTAGSGGTGGVPTSSMSTAGAGSTSVSSVADGMERVRISDEGQNQMEATNPRQRHYTESVIRDYDANRVSPGTLRKQISSPAAQSPPEGLHASYNTPQSLRWQQQQVPVPQLTSTPQQQSHVAPPPINQPKFPQATEESPYYKHGLEQDLQPVLPNPSSDESMSAYQHYSMVANNLLKARVYYDKLLEERANLDKEIEEDQRRLQSKEGIQREYQSKRRRREFLLSELKSLQDTYDQLTRGGPEHR